uniref:Ubiquitin-like protease family profile domain-containing protein n=1 Tax=Amphiprion ocellaris TaxID=80972 RepID=A0AAQ5XP61_AMPOC
MSSPFRIPKKKQEVDCSSAHQSPLASLQSPAPTLKGYGGWPTRVGAARVHAGKGVSSERRKAVQRPLQAPFRDEVKTLLGLDGGGASAGSRGGQSEPGQRAESSCCSDRWRPKRASDRLLQPEHHLPPPQKKKSVLSSGERPPSIAVETGDSLDSLAALRPEGHAGSPSPSPPGLQRWRTVECSGDRKEQVKRRRSPDRGRSLDVKEDIREKERQRWIEFRENNRSTVLHLRLKPKPSPTRRKPSQTEPIVLSSEEEDEDEETRMLQSSSRLDESCRERSDQVSSLEAPPSFLQLPFASLHAGLMEADTNGMMMVTEHAITIPVKGVEEGEVTVVASQVRGYGVWDGGVAQGGALLASWEGPAPSLLFLWVTDAQANLLQKELLAIQTSSGPPCSFVLLVLKEQLQELQAALLASILDMDPYQEGRSCGSGPASPLDWADGLLLLHSCPPPLDQHLLRLLGHSTVRRSSGPPKTSDPENRLSCSLRNKTRTSAELPTRLIQYPEAPSKGRITVTNEDLVCLQEGNFLNDVIIDFYLKFLFLEGVGGSVPDRSHVFSSFFFRQLSRRRAAREDDPSVSDHQVRHQRVKTWTRHVDIFTKDFLFVPVNQEAHWFLVVVCFPGLQENRHEQFQPSAVASERPAGKLNLRSSQPPDCSLQGCQKDLVLQRPCILVMDSLKLSCHENVCRLLRERCFQRNSGSFTRERCASTTQRRRE